MIILFTVVIKTIQCKLFYLSLQISSLWSNESETVNGLQRYAINYGHKKL